MSITTVANKTIVCTTMEDVRFLRGENVVDALDSEFSFGKKMKLFFSDHTYMEVEVVETNDAEHILGTRMGTWRSVEGGLEGNGVIEIVT